MGFFALQYQQRRRTLALLLIVTAPCVSSWSPSSTSCLRLRADVHASQHQRLPTTSTTSSPATDLRMAGNDQDGGSSKSKQKTTGVYARPSAAIERGSGFFIPGLEGSRVRLLFGILALVLTYVNNSLGSVTTGGFDISETVAVLAGVLLLLQAAVEFGQELGFGVQQKSGASDATIGDSGTSAAAASSANLEQRIAPSLVDRGTEAVDAIKWAAATYVALTPASHVIVVADNGEGTEPTFLYELGDFGNSADDNNMSSDIETGAKAAIDEVHNSKGGRVSLPFDHPAAINLLPESGRRCVLLQRISAADPSGGRRLCMVVGSNQLLQAFTKNDLRWLGRLAQYTGKAL